MEGTVTRSYDVSHLTRTCEGCGEFERHVNQRVIDQYEAFEADPPEGLDWAGLDRTRKFVVAERVVRHGRSVESLAGDRREPEIESDAEPDTEDRTAQEGSPADAAVSGEPDAGESGDGNEGDDADADGDASREVDPGGTGTDSETEADSDGPASHDSTPSGSD